MTSKRESALIDDRSSPSIGAVKELRIWLAMLAVGYVFYLLLPILMPFVTAALLAYVFNPMVDRLCGIRLGKFILGRASATVFLMILLTACVLGLLLVVAPLLQKELMLLLQRLPQYFMHLRAYIEPLLQKHFALSFDLDMARLQQVMTGHWKNAGNLFGQFLLGLSSQGAALLAWLANVLIIPVVLFYLLRDWPNFLQYLADLLPRRWLPSTQQIVREIDQVLAEFLRGQLAVMLLMSLFYALELWLAGLELAMPIALIAGLLGFVPYFGVGIGLILAVLAALLQFNSLGACLPVLVVFGLGQLLESMALTPWLVGDRIGLHPVAVIFLLMAGGQLFGFTGILLALPAGATLAVGLRHLKDLYQSSASYHSHNRDAT